MGWNRWRRSSFPGRVLPVWIAAALLITPLSAEDSKLERQYRHQQGKLKRQGRVVKRVKIFIKLSNIDLKLVSRQVKTGRYAEADRLLMKYVENIRQAEQVLKDSKRNPQRKSGGFKHLEISLRKQRRQLADIRDLYPFDRQQAIARAIDCAEAVKQRMIAALFGADNTRLPADRSPEVGEARALGDPSPCPVE